MDIVVTGRHCTISDAVREQVTQRLASVEKLRDRVIRIEVEFTSEESKGNPHDNMLCEITLRSKGPVVRAEAYADDKMVAFDKAMDRLKTQLRRASDRRKNHRGLRAHQVVAALEPLPTPEETGPETKNVAGITVTGDGPLVVREKEFTSAPLTLAQALDEMELVGHDFFLYLDADSGKPSVVYRRKGYDYGVIHLSQA
ncbi:ribosome hibernation-promoting factor, HPF/YfiA family [Luteococcus sp. OSA5]|uniref:ribosome hibernation-promoting factor, HPF/YfiA family n=1 Tax=Luteococcus sp. OSA5 TaxID=3401630 RepID=UPI003B434630